MFFCGTFGALVPCDQQGGHHQGGQRDGAHGRRAQLKRPPRVRVRGGATRPTRHRMMFFCGTFGALVPCDQQGGHHQGGQRDGAHGRRAQLKRPPRVRVRAARDES